MSNYLLQGLLSLTLLFSFSATAKAQTFPYSSITSTGIASANYGIIDWDSDGDNDIVLHAPAGPGGVSPYCRVLLNNGAASFSDGGWPFSCGEASFETRDFDGDGKTDLILNLGRDGIQFYRMTNEGLMFSFQAPQSLRSAGIGLGDIDGDTDLDLLICGLSDALEPRTLLYRNIGNDLVSVAHNIPNTASVSFQGGCNLIKIDNDALADVAIAGCQSTSPSCGANRRLYIFKGLDGSSFQSQGQLASTGGDGTTVWVDIEYDGDLDWIVQSNGPKVFLNQGNFSFSATALSGGQRTESRFTVLDYDQDGDVDILERWIYSITSQAQTSVYRNDNGGFTTVSHSLNSSYGHSIAADLDRDLNPEILLGETNASDMIYKNTLKSIVGFVWLNGAGLVGTTIAMSGAAGGTSVTSSSGIFSFLNVPVGNFLITPVLPGYVFSPESRSVQIDSDSSLDTIFVASLEPTPTPAATATRTPTPMLTATPSATLTNVPVSLPVPKVQVNKKSVEVSVTQSLLAADQVRFFISGPRVQNKLGKRIKSAKNGRATFATKFLGLVKGTYQASWELTRAGSDKQRSSAKSFKVK